MTGSHHDLVLVGQAESAGQREEGGLLHGRHGDGAPRGQHGDGGGLGQARLAAVLGDDDAVPETPQPLSQDSSQLNKVVKYTTWQ